MTESGKIVWTDAPLKAADPKRAAALTEEQQKGRAQVVHGAVAALLSVAPADGIYDYVMEQFEKPLLEAMLRRHKGSRSALGRALGLDRHTVLKKLRWHGLDRP